MQGSQHGVKQLAQGSQQVTQGSQPVEQRNGLRPENLLLIRALKHRIRSFILDILRCMSDSRLVPQPLEQGLQEAMQGSQVMHGSQVTTGAQHGSQLTTVGQQDEEVKQIGRMFPLLPRNAAGVPSPGSGAGDGGGTSAGPSSWGSIRKSVGRD